MQPEPIVRLRTILLCMFCIFCFNNAFSQGKIDWSLDTVSYETAKKAQAKFKTEMTNLNKKATSQMTMDVSKLKEVMDLLYSKNISNVTFLLTSIRKEDTAQYARRNPGMSNSARNDLIGRQQVIIRIPREALVSQSGSRINNKTSGLLTALLLIGITPLENGFPKWGNNDIYLTLGTICPPPASCSE